jgi:(p)ppGpp synthase/HD superfamily hydrolase
MYEKALNFASRAHEGQLRRMNKRIPYIEHPIAVANAFDSDEYKTVAILHDVVEDTRFTLVDIREEFGDVVSEAVDALTKRKGETYLELVLRAKDNEIARKVKIADIKHNMSDLKKGSLKSKYELALYILENDL